MKVNKSELLAALKADFTASKRLRAEQDQIVDTYKREYRGEPYGNEKTNKSKIVSKDIRKQDEWLHPSLLDPFVSTNDIVKVAPVTWEDGPAARQSELLLNYQFCRQFNRYSFMSKALKVLSQEGTLVVQTGWDYQDEEVEVEVPLVGIDLLGQEFIAGMTQTTETKVIKNQPTATVCRNEDIFIDPTCMDDMDKCQFVIHRYETDYSTLKSDGRYKNLEKVMQSVGGQLTTDYQHIPEDETYFKFKDDARKKLVVYEYWGNYDVNGDGIAEPIVCAWISDIIIRLQDNPYPDKKPPFLVVPFNSVPFKMYGESDAELISDNQKIKTAITRGIIDNMAQSNNGQVGVAKGALDPTNRKRFLSGDNFEFNRTPNDFWHGSYNEIPASAFNMIGVMNNEIESLTAVKSFSGGMSGNQLGSTATGVRGVLDATSVRRLNRVRNISENLIKPLMRKWLAYSSEFLDDTEIVRVTNDDFVQINRDDLSGKVDLDISVSTSEDNAVKAQELSFLLQTLGQGMDQEMTQFLMAEISRLYKMPELEKKFKEFQPKPDPMQEQLKQLAVEKAMLENAKIKAEIEQLYASAHEDEADYRAKVAGAMVKEAQARKLTSEADIKDLDFLMKDQGVDAQREDEMFEKKRLHDLDMAAFQQLAGDKNIGFPDK